MITYPVLSEIIYTIGLDDVQLDWLNNNQSINEKITAFLNENGQTVENNEFVVDIINQMIQITQTNYTNSNYPGNTFFLSFQTFN